MGAPVPPTWNTTGMPASSARAHTGSRPMWLGEWPGGQPEATSRAAAPGARGSSARARARAGAASGGRRGGGSGGEALLGQRRGPVEVGQRDVAGRQQALVDRAELDHAPVVGPGDADGQLVGAARLP